METYPLNLEPPTEKELETTPVWKDYSFNQSIIDALKEGKSVWSRCNCGDPDCGTWNATNRDTKILLAQVFEDSWALEKPKTKVKKWQWIYK